MIDRFEIMELSREVGLRPDVVEKDYVLGWVLGMLLCHQECPLYSLGLWTFGKVPTSGPIGNFRLEIPFIRGPVI
jgi:hypothetical protein